MGAKRRFESLEADRETLLKTLAELRAGKLRRTDGADAPQLISDIEQRIDELTRQIGGEWRRQSEIQAERAGAIDAKAASVRKLLVRYRQGPVESRA